MGLLFNKKQKKKTMDSTAISLRKKQNNNFNKAIEQINILRLLNSERGYGFPESIFKKVESALPDFTEDMAESQVLVIFPKLETPQETLKESCFLLQDIVENVWISEVKEDLSNIEFRKKIHEKGLYLEALDLCANEEKSVSSVRQTTSSPEFLLGFSGLWLAYQNPKLVREFNRCVRPQMLFSGFDVNGDDGLKRVLGLRYIKNLGQIEIDTFCARTAHIKTCSPAVKRSMGLLYNK